MFRYKYVNEWKRKLPADVFKRLDMAGGDTTQCWKFNGYRPPHAPAGIIVVCGRHLYVRKLVYSQWTGKAYEKLPRLTSVCGNDTCVNPTHMRPKKGSTVFSTVVDPPTI